MADRVPSDAVVRAWARLVKAQHLVLSAVESDLKAAGFPPLAWYDVLLELSRANGGGLRPLEIEGRLLLAQHNVSRLLDRLERAGHVERHPCPDDGRGQLVTITASGRDVPARLWPPYGDAIARHVGDTLAADARAAALADLLGLLIGPATTTKLAARPDPAGSSPPHRPRVPR